jgi:hypothetical protein
MVGISVGIRVGTGEAALQAASAIEIMTEPAKNSTYFFCIGAILHILLDYYPH